MVDRVKVYYTDDDSLKLLGELLSNKTSRSMLIILSEKPYYTNELSKKLNISVSLVIHHLKKLEELGLVDITNHQIVKRGIDRRFFELKSDIFISKTDKETTEKTGKLKKMFKESVKFMAIFLVAGFVWGFERARTNTSEFDDFIEKGEVPPTNELGNLVIPLVVIIIGLSIILGKKYLNR